MATSVMVSGTAGMPREALSVCLEVRYRMKVAPPCEVEELKERIRESGIQVVVLAPTLGSLPDITRQAASDIREAGSKAGLVVISYQVDASEAREAIEAGAQGMVSVGEGLEKLKEAIVSVSHHEEYVSPRIGSRVVHLKPGQGKKISEIDEEILKLVALGYSTRQIADQVYLSERTIENHRSRINQTLGFEDRKDLVAYALKEGMLS